MYSATNSDLRERVLAAFERNAKRSRWMFSSDGDAALTSVDLDGTKNRSGRARHPLRIAHHLWFFAVLTCPSSSSSSSSASVCGADSLSVRVRVLHELHSAYATVKHLPLPVPVKLPATTGGRGRAAGTTAGGAVTVEDDTDADVTTVINSTISELNQPKAPAAAASSTALTPYQPPSSALPASGSSGAVLPFDLSSRSRALSLTTGLHYTAPVWHPPWRLLRVMAGHQGWVRSIAVDPSNDFFISASNDRTLKCWDLASGELRLTLTGHVSSVRAVCISTRHPYLFSASEDKSVRCWDLEQNKVIRSYHGHLSGVYCLALHPQLDVLLSGGRDSAVRVWEHAHKGGD